MQEERLKKEVKKSRKIIKLVKEGKGEMEIIRKKEYKWK